jgi:hypothetical protein
MHHPRRTSLIGRGLLAIGGVLLLLAIASALIPGVSPEAVAATTPLTVTATPATALLDGDAIAIRVAAGAGQKINFGSRARICRDGPVYDSADDLLPFGPGNCPNAGLSSSATPGGVASLDPLPDGSAAIGSLRVGTGRVEWGPATDPTKFSLTCDAANPCRLVLDVQTSTGRVIDGSTQIQFSDSEALGACGGAAPGVLSAAGSDRFIDTWARWTRDQCQSAGVKASSNAVLAGEGPGLDAFALGQADMAYSATGPAIPSRPIETPRASVSVPVALNAVVVGMLGGYPSNAPDWPSGIPRPFSDVKVTSTEMATLFGQGFFGFSPQPGTPTINRNPQLAGGVTGLGGPALAPSGSEATTYFATRWFDTRSGSSWLTPSVPLDDIPSLTPRGVTDEMAAADPPFAVAISSQYSARSSLKQKVAAASLASAGNYPITWVLTDLATANQLGIPVASLENSRGEFVAPTAESLAAAVGSMETAEDGTVVPGTGPDAAGAYPLTFVEHIVAPAEPLLDTECAPRTDSQKLLANWVSFVTGPGQESLEGLQPLTPELATVAASSAKKIGTAPVTGPCKPEETPPTTTPTTPVAPVPPAAPGGFDTGSGFDTGGIPASSSFGSTDLGGTTSDALGAQGDEVQPSDPESAEDAAESGGEPSLPAVPRLLASQRLGGSSGAVALVGLAFLGAGAGMLSAGRSPRRKPVA